MDISGCVIFTERILFTLNSQLGSHGCGSRVEGQLCNCVVGLDFRIMNFLKSKLNKGNMKLSSGR